MPVWVNGKFRNTENKKAEKWIPAPQKEKVLWGLCRSCGGAICEGDSVGMVADHDKVVCYDCWLAGALPEGHLDCAGLRLPGETLSQ